MREGAGPAVAQHQLNRQLTLSLSFFLVFCQKRLPLSWEPTPSTFTQGASAGSTHDALGVSGFCAVIGVLHLECEWLLVCVCMCV